MIYFDNAATTFKKPKEVIDAINYALLNYTNSGRGAYRAALDSGRMVYETRVKLAAFFGSNDPSKVIFTSNATEALNITLFGLLHAKDHVISTVTEHNSVLRPLYKLESSKGVSIDFVSIDECGRLKCDEFEKYIHPNTKAIVINHISNVSGEIADIEYVGKVAKKHNLYLIVDASQSAGSIDIDMTKLGIDILCFTGHKSLFGPGGTGGIVINGDILLDTFKVGGSGVQSFNKCQPSEYPTRLEAGTLNIMGIAGLLAGIEFINKVGKENIHKKEMRLIKRFYEGIRDIEGIKFYFDTQSLECEPENIRHGSIVSFNLGKIPSADLADCLGEDYDIAIRAGAHCAPLIHEAFNTKKDGIARFSFSYFNTEAEVDEAIKAIKEIAVALVD